MMSNSQLSGVVEAEAISLVERGNGKPGNGFTQHGPLENMPGAVVRVYDTDSDARNDPQIFQFLLSERIDHKLTAVVLL